MCLVALKWKQIFLPVLGGRGRRVRVLRCAHMFFSRGGEEDVSLKEFSILFSLLFGYPSRALFRL